MTDEESDEMEAVEFDDDRKEQLDDFINMTIIPAISEDLCIEPGTAAHQEAMQYLIDGLTSRLEEETTDG